MKNYLNSILETFFGEIYSRGISQNTLKAYQADLNSFVKHCKAVPAKITSIDLREYQEYLREKMKPATVNRRMVSVKQFLTWAYKKGLIDHMPSFPENMAVQKSAPRVLNKVEQNRLLREVERQNKARDIALLRLLMDCGLRVSELVGINMKDINMGERHGSVTVKGKGSKHREVPLPIEARKAVKAWLVEREKNHLNQWLFPNKNGNHISSRYVETLIKNYGRFAGLEIHPHVMRHTAAANMLKAGIDLVAVAQVLGHANLNTTMIYAKPGRKTMEVRNSHKIINYS